jgi:hypothetical protein
MLEPTSEAIADTVVAQSMLKRPGSTAFLATQVERSFARVVSDPSVWAVERNRLMATVLMNFEEIV